MFVPLYALSATSIIHHVLLRNINTWHELIVVGNYSVFWNCFSCPSLTLTAQSMHCWHWLAGGLQFLLSGKCSMACMAASMPEIWPAYICTEPAASCTPCVVMFKMALMMMCLAVSPIPMGRTPWFLLRAMRRLGISSAMLAGSTNSVQRHFAAMASEWQSSKDSDLKEVHSLLHPSTSRTEAPAAPLVCKAVDLIIAASRDSGWFRVGIVRVVCQ